MKTKDLTKEQALEQIELLKERIDFNNRLNKFVRKYSKEHKLGRGEENFFNGYWDEPTPDMIEKLKSILAEETWMDDKMKALYLHSASGIFGQTYSPAVNTYILKDLHDCEKYIKTFDNAVKNETEENDLFSIERDTKENRINLYFDGKPEETIRSCLKRNGFRWSPKFMCWTRQLTDEAEKSLARIKRELNI